jgi:glycosyltransferase involved in cell wall biosynthesis
VRSLDKRGIGAKTRIARWDELTSKLTGPPRHKTDTEPRKITDGSLVSIVVPTRNSAATLGMCLQSLKEQTYPDIEIIVVDNNSQDKTQEISKGFGVIPIVAGKERSEQTNLGAKKARGKYLFRTDADFVFDSTLISRAVEVSQKGGFDAVIVHGTSDPTISRWARIRKAERECFEGDWAHTAASFFKKEAFEAVGGFNEILTAFEDYDLNNRFIKAGFKIGRIDARAIHIGEPRSLAEVVPKYIYYGARKNVMEFASKNPGKGLWQIMPVRLVYLKNLRKFGLDFFPFLVYHYVKYASAAIGYLIS